MKPTDRWSALIALAIAFYVAIPAHGENARDAKTRKTSLSAKPAAQPLKSLPVRVTISKETTYVTGPLRKDGYVDYFAALNERFGKGVTSENNSAVLFWKVMGPHEIDKANRERYFKMLGIPPLAEQGDYYVPFYQYVKGLKGAGKTAPAKTEEQVSEETMRQYAQATERPWSKKEFPLMAGWLAANERPLALLTEACKRPRHYDPVIGDDVGPMIAFILPVIQSHREAARVLLARAMLRVGEGDVEAAWEDLLSCHRFARLIGQGPTLVEYLVAIAIDGIADAGDQALLRSIRLTSAQAMKIRGDLGKLPPMPRMAEAIDVAERFFYLDFISMAARDGLMPLRGLVDASEPPAPINSLINLAAGAALDWNEILRIGNSWYDRMADAFRKPTGTERKAALGKIDEDMRKLAARTKDLKSLALPMLGNPRQALSRRLGETLVALLLPAVTAAAQAEDRGTVQFELIRVAFALAAYRADHGAYPAKLADLVPKYCAEVPKDPFIAADLHYQRVGEGYVLYSVGVNGKDDGAKGYNDRAGNGQDWDDLVVRIPGTNRQERMN